MNERPRHDRVRQKRPAGTKVTYKRSSEAHLLCFLRKKNRPKTRTSIHEKDRREGSSRARIRREGLRSIRLSPPRSRSDRSVFAIRRNVLRTGLPQTNAPRTCSSEAVPAARSFQLVRRPRRKRHLPRTFSALVPLSVFSLSNRGPWWALLPRVFEKRSPRGRKKGVPGGRPRHDCPPERRFS